MPTYEYQCLPHGHRFEVRHGITEGPITECQICGSPVRRVIQPVGVVFKGSGFYATDSRKGARPKSSDNGADGDAKPDTSSEKKPDAKSETKSEPKSESKPEAKPKSEPAAS